MGYGFMIFNEFLFMVMQMDDNIIDLVLVIK